MIRSANLIAFYVTVVIFSAVSRQSYAENNPCSKAIERNNFTTGFGDIWTVDEKGLVHVNTQYLIFSTVETLNGSRRGYRVTSLFSRWITEIVLNHTNTRLMYVRTYSASSALPENSEDTFDSDYTWIRYRFTYNSNGHCLPVSVGGGKNWLGSMQPIFDGDVCAKISDKYSELFKSRRVVGGPASRTISYDHDQLKELAKILDAEKVAPVMRWDFQKGNVGSVSSLYITSSEPNIFDSTIMVRASRLLYNCRINQASPNIEN